LINDEGYVVAFVVVARNVNIEGNASIFNNMDVGEIKITLGKEGFLGFIWF
jgi:hypothetical protein